jgi:biopolymer transport protein ExbB/TolQ
VEHLQSLLYWISSAFLLPALLAILCLFLYATFLAGGVFAEAYDRRANREALRLLYEGEPGVDRFLRLDWKLSMGRFAAAAANHPERLDKAVADLENELRQRAERLSVLSRTGPMLGLIGTLIPLQPALAGLAAGDMQAMASNLLIGFTTTVVGLIVGGASYALGVQVRHWGRQDLTEMHYLMEIWSAGAGKDEPNDAAKTN